MFERLLEWLGLRPKKKKVESVRVKLRKLGGSFDDPIRDIGKGKDKDKDKDKNNYIPENNQPKVKEDLKDLKNKVKTEELNNSSKNSTKKSLAEWLGVYNAVGSDVAKQAIYKMAKRDGIDLKDSNGQLKQTKEKNPNMLKYVKFNDKLKMSSSNAGKSNFMNNSSTSAMKSARSVK